MTHQLLLLYDFIIYAGTPTETHLLVSSLLLKNSQTSSLFCTFLPRTYNQERQINFFDLQLAEHLSKYFAASLMISHTFI